MTQSPRQPQGTGPRVTKEQVRDVSSLRRPAEPRIFGGVAEGVARHLDVDPLLVRVVLAALTVFGGAGIVLYTLAWVTIPAEGEYDSVLSRALRRDPSRVMLAGLSIAVVVTVATMIGTIGLSAPNPVPVMVVSVVAIALFALFSRRPERSSQAVRGGTAERAVIGDSRRGPPSHLFGITMAIVAVLLGTLWVVDQTVRPVTPSAFPAAALGVIAVALVVGAWWGRSRLLILAGLAATVATLMTTIVGPGPYGERVYSPRSTAELSSTYDHGAGRVVVHLEDLSDRQNLKGQTVHITNHLGQVVVIVPSSIDVGVNAHVDHGDIRGLDNEQDLGEGEKQVTAPVGAHDLTVDIEVDFGEIVVTRLACPQPVAVATDSSLAPSTDGGGDVAPACN